MRENDVILRLELQNALRCIAYGEKSMKVWRQIRQPTLHATLPDTL